MLFRKRSRKASTVNLLELIPERRYEWVTADDGNVKILIPRYGKNALGVWFARQLNRPYIYYSLDRIGSAVWLACDGRTTVSQIATRLQRQFGEEIEPVYDRLSQFLYSLDRNKLIRFKNLYNLASRG